MSSLWLNEHRKNVYSQNGEDGVLAAIFEKIGTTNLWCCDVGAHNGFTFSNVADLILKNWTGVLIEADTEKFQELLKGFPDLRAVKLNRLVRPGMLDSVLTETFIPKEFDLLNIDVDSEDCQIWEELEAYRPRVVVIEVDSCCPPEIDRPSDRYMSTLREVVAVGKKKGYELALHTGNAIFVLRECCEVLGVDPDNWQELFNRSWIS